MKTSEKLLNLINEKGIKKGWICDYLGMSRPTLTSRIINNSFTLCEIEKLKKIGLD
jgi:predicted XRE-type DNA-binding protein